MQGQGENLDLASPAADAAASLTTRAQLVFDRLLAAYGPQRPRPHEAPLDELIGTILSQHTSDVNSSRAFASLRRAFPTWDLALGAAASEIADAIRVGGLADVKARRIKSLLAELQERYGSLSLDFLADLTTEEARAVLEAIPGVGPKTSACVLLFSLGRPVVPVDTHVHRVSRRIGLAPPDASPEEVERALEAELRPEQYYCAHVNLIRHGRQICRAQRPLCEICPVADLCDYYRMTRGAL